MANKGEEGAELVHGVLDVTIFQADHLHHSIPGFFLEVVGKVEESLHLHTHHKLYATIDVGTARVARTREVGFHPTHPTWNESFRLYCAHYCTSITISIKKQLPVSAHVLGRAHIPVSRILTSEPLEGRFDLFDEEGKQLKKAQIHALLKFSHVTADPCWNAGIRIPEFRGIRNAFFPQRTACDVVLYQNSHLSQHFQPKIRLSNGKMYKPSRLWEDVYHAIMDAKYFIYVAGWSVNVNITLVRDPERMIPGAENVTLGELLKRKADDGVDVRVMVWQDRTSLAILDNAGIMGTHDEETRLFFHGTNVKCFLCPRDADTDLTAVQQVEADVQFTHHQKTLSLDAPFTNTDGSVRQVISFVGGIDLCGGRYDDENHTLFRHLDTTYLNDFHQGNFSEADFRHGGPREPWHDAHSRLEGRAAWDVLVNFQQRWTKQSPADKTNSMLNIEQMPTVFPVPSEHSETNQNSWNVQVFRSIDDASVTGFPSEPSVASEMGLVSGKDVTIDQSIHSGYVEAIRRAKRFIYIENQYFLGSCAAWKEEQDCGCLNLVPIEIALKVADKIRRGERFAVYVVTPMWPEGKPEGRTVQAILKWNRLTMEMMYGIVAGAIEEAGLGGKVHPCDYLNFYCLGNREVRREGEYVPPEKPEPETDYWRAQVNRRFMIYLHAKLMIVDDEYVIVGSANLNQRSLAGDRDTEIAQGSYQPAHLNGPTSRAHGIIHGFRMSVWYEHFMSHCPHLHHVFLEPENLDCVRTVKRIAENLWEKFVGDEVVDLPGHLLPFPIRVSEAGELSELPEDGLFPDTEAQVKGKKSDILPPILTT